MTNSHGHHTSARIGGQETKLLAPALALVALTLTCFGQGTMTFTFEGLPRGTQGLVGTYTESGMQFGMAYGPGSLALSGGGIPGYADNGTGNLGIPDGIPGGNGDTRFEFGFNLYPPTNPQILFHLLSFDAAEYDSQGPQTLEVVGYQAQIMAPTLTVTNCFAVNSLTFQTFYLDSSFTNVFKVDVFNARWSLDNLVISGVPEPSVSGLILLGMLCGLGWWRRRGQVFIGR